MTGHDAVIVGAGPAGAALAACLARSGFSVLLLERDTLKDGAPQRRVLRGEWIAPWGVKELQALGLYDAVAADAQLITRHIRYDRMDVSTPLEESVLDLSSLVPGVAGPLGIEYPRLRRVLVGQAVQAGVDLQDGAHLIDIVTGRVPFVTYEANGVDVRATARVIIGADGRAGMTRKKFGASLHAPPLHHYICGLLIGPVGRMSGEVELNVVAEKIALMTNGVGEGRFRTYLYFDPETFRSIGSWRLEDMYRTAMQIDGAPGLAEITAGRAIGAGLGMPNTPTWIDRPYAHGGVLIGDAAGSDDPTTGQGLSIAFRDVRLVAEILKESADWGHPDLFRPYARDKAETLRRLRFTSAVFSIRDAEFTEAASRRRRDVRRRLAKDPARGLGLLSQYLGPERLPESAFSVEAWRAIFDGEVEPPDFITDGPNHAESLCV